MQVLLLQQDDYFDISHKVCRRIHQLILWTFILIYCTLNSLIIKDIYPNMIENSLSASCSTTVYLANLPGYQTAS